jgi:hypothetical protein
MTLSFRHNRGYLFKRGLKEEFLPGYGENRISVSFDIGDLIVTIFYDSDDGESQISLVSNTVAFKELLMIMQDCQYLAFTFCHLSDFYISFTSFYKRFTKLSTKTCRFVGMKLK